VPDGEAELRPARQGDARAVATLHARLITEGFLSSLGPRFLHRLYRRIVRSEDCFVLVAHDAGTPVGFIAGTESLGRLYRRFLVHDGVVAGLSAPVRIVSTLPRVLETLRHGTGEPGAAGAELLAVAVDPAWRGRHVGARLVDGFLAEVERRGITRAQVVVGAGNTAAVAMYGRAGFTEAGAFEMHRGTESLVLATPVPAGGRSA